MLFEWPTRLRPSAYRSRYGITLFLALIASFVGTGRCPAATAMGSPDLIGIWKLVVHSPGDDQEWVIIEIKQADGKSIVEMVDKPKLFGKPQIYLEKSPDGLVVLIADGQTDITFKGRLHEGGADGRLVGVFQFRSLGLTSTSPASLEKTTATKVAAPREPQEKPGAAATIGFLVGSRKAVSELLDDRYKSLDVAIAEAAAVDIPIDAPTAVRAWAVSRKVDAAGRAGKSDAAAETELAKLKALIALESRPPTVPLVVEPAAGGRDPQGDRVVLVELFTGAQCGPCVAADVAFDALSTAYNSTNLITLQYHLHIPGPDPLTGPDSVSRQAYYGVRSTPSTYFNGQALAGSGGPVADSRRKFNQYRHVIDEQQKGKRNATIELAARLTGDEVHITASAKVGDGAATAALQPRLRFALVEESVAYTGRNRLPLHHHVVRAMPGGSEGRALEAGMIRIEETIKLSDVRTSQAAYLKEYPASPKSRGSFRDPLPRVELKKLHVAAFLQDDSDRQVLDAIIVPVD
jgi:hypothetical protein